MNSFHTGIFHKVAQCLVCRGHFDLGGRLHGPEISVNYYRFLFRSIVRAFFAFELFRPRQYATAAQKPDRFGLRLFPKLPFFRLTVTGCFPKKLCIIQHRAGARAVDLEEPSVYQGGPKLEFKYKSRCLQNIKFVNWGAKHVDWGGARPPLGAGPDSTSFNVLSQGWALDKLVVRRAALEKSLKPRAALFRKAK